MAADRDEFNVNKRFGTGAFRPMPLVPSEFDPGVLRAGGILSPRTLSPEIILKDRWLPERLRETLKLDPRTQLGRAVREILKYVPDMPAAREAAAELLDRLSSCVIVESALYGIVKRGALWCAGNAYWGERTEDYGLLGTKVVTTTGCGFIVDAFQNLVELELMKFHGIGTGSGAEAAADTALGTELTTEYSPNSTRATGSLTEVSALVFQTVGTNTLDGTPGASLREHGLFSNATVGSGVLLDRTVFAAISLSSGDALQTDYRLTLSAGG